MSIRHVGRPEKQFQRRRRQRKQLIWIIAVAVDDEEEEEQDEIAMTQNIEWMNHKLLRCFYSVNNSTLTLVVQNACFAKMMQTELMNQAHTMPQCY